MQTGIILHVFYADDAEQHYTHRTTVQELLLSAALLYSYNFLAVEMSRSTGTVLSSRLSSPPLKTIRSRATVGRTVEPFTRTVLYCALQLQRCTYAAEALL